MRENNEDFDEGQKESDWNDLKRVLSVFSDILGPLGASAGLASVLVLYFVSKSYLTQNFAVWVLPQFLDLSPIYFFLIFILMTLFFNVPIFLGFAIGIAEKFVKEDVSENHDKNQEPVSNRNMSTTKKFLLKKSKAILWIKATFHGIFLQKYFLNFLILLETLLCIAEMFLLAKYSNIFPHVLFILVYILNPLCLSFIEYKLMILNKNKNKEVNIEYFLVFSFFNIAVYVFYSVILLSILSGSVASTWRTNSLGGYFVILLFICYPLFLHLIGTIFGNTMKFREKPKSAFIIFSSVLVIFPVVATIVAWPYANFSDDVMSELGLGGFYARISYQNRFVHKLPTSYYVVANVGDSIYVRESLRVIDFGLNSKNYCVCPPKTDIKASSNVITERISRDDVDSFSHINGCSKLEMEQFKSLLAKHQHINKRIKMYCDLQES